MAGDDDGFETLLRGVAKTPEVVGLRRAIRPGTRLKGRFEIEARLGRGGMGSVYAAWDAVRGERVALKVLGTLTPESIRRIKREFRAAADLLHPNLIGLHGLFSDGLEWFLTMDLIDGVSLPETRRLHGPLGTDQLRHLFGQLALALHELHAVGTLHGDLTPSNFMIVGETRRVVLLDFGISRSLREAQPSKLRAGTPGYMSPEQERGELLSEASDWYSFGVVLREALSEHAATCPELEALRDQLLQPPPAARARGADVLARLGVKQAETARISSAPPAAQSVLGRETELARLMASYQRVVAGEPSIALLHGPSGIGKTCLVEEFLRRVRGKGALTLGGRCRERESVGHKAVDVLIDDMIELLDQLPMADARQLLPRDLADLCRLFPALRAANSVAQAAEQSRTTRDQSLARHRAISALRELVLNLRDLGQLVVWIDGLQWGDADSAELLGPILNGPAAVPLLFIGSFRSTNAGRGPTLDTLLVHTGPGAAGLLEITLEPLAPRFAEQLAKQLLSDHPRAATVAQMIAREAEGHPLFVAELAHASSAGHLIREGVPTSLGALVRQRIAGMPALAQQVLHSVATAGAPTTRGVVRRSRDLEPAAFERALDLLRVNRLTRTSGVSDESECDVVHDRIREIVLKTIDAPERRSLHLALARALEAEPLQRPERIASHFQQAAQIQAAGRYWIAAADQAVLGLAFARGAQLFELGVAQADLGPEELNAVNVRRAEALAFAGAGALAAALYLRVADSCRREQALELQRRAAEQLLLSGHLERGLLVVRQVLDALGMRDTRAALP